MKVDTRSKLTREALTHLVNGDIFALRVPDFYAADACVELCSKIQASSLRGQYHNAPAITRIGTSLFETQVSEQVRRDYVENAVRWISEIRKSVSPLSLPIDTLRLTLDEIWPAGSTLAMMLGARAFCGLVRVFAPGVEAEPHMDVLEWDIAEAESEYRLSAQIAANVYLQLPVEGGDLIVWPVSYTKEEYQAAMTAAGYGINRATLPREYLRITPQRGDLVMFNSRLVHMVEPGINDDRISASCFVGVEDEREPLVCWS